MSKPILISGIQPSGKLHVGNYLGALKNFVELQNSGNYECFFFIADYHSITEEFNPTEKHEAIKEVVMDYLAAGINPEKSTIFVQSALPAHTELAWILSAIAPLGELERMTQFKDKSTGAPQNINVGLFTYPVLMAADILLYDANVVPVGEDQLQHLELTRTLARKFNKKFGRTFIEPKPLLTKTPRVMSLDDPKKKMSKSRPAGCLFLDDTPKEMQSKIKKAVTDSGNEIRFDWKNKPAISNLIGIWSAFSGKTEKEAEKQFKGKSYVEFKEELVDTLVETLTPFQRRKQDLRNQERKIKEIVRNGNKNAGRISEKKLGEVKKKIGLS